jgi:hypothetical protein
MIEPPPLKELLLNFESFGDNCEFGLIQRQAGLEPLALLRFSFTPLTSLLRALGCGFHDVAAPENIEVTTASNKELVITVRGYDLVYHSQRNEGDITPEELKRQEIIKLKFLSRQTMEGLRNGDKIFVRKGEGMKSLDDALTLHKAMSKYGAPPLLWISDADALNPSGSVRMVAPGLLWGRIDQFASYIDAQSTSFTAWITTLRNAYMLWKRAAPAGTIAPPPAPAPGNNLLRTTPPDAQFEGLSRIILLMQHVTYRSILGALPRRTAATSLSRIVLVSDGTGMIGVRASGLTPGEPYTFSLWLRVEEETKLEQAWVLFQNLPALRSRRIGWGNRHIWQRLEVAASAPPDGLMFPRINLSGQAGSVVYLANWRLEPGLLVEADEHPDPPPVS